MGMLIASPIFPTWFLHSWFLFLSDFLSFVRGPFVRKVSILFISRILSWCVPGYDGPPFPAANFLPQQRISFSRGESPSPATNPPQQRVKFFPDASLAFRGQVLKKNYKCCKRTVLGGVFFCTCLFFLSDGDYGRTDNSEGSSGDEGRTDIREEYSYGRASAITTGKFLLNHQCRVSKL